MTAPVMTSAGKVSGALDDRTGVYSFKGIPFAAPPVGDLRWKPPQPAPPWPGVRRARRFGPRAMQLPVFGDMNFRSNGMSEDCLYLNVWTPAPSATARLDEGAEEQYMVWDVNPHVMVERHQDRYAFHV